MDFNIDIKGLNESRKQTVKDILELLKENDRVACVRYTGYGKSYYIVKNLIKEWNKPTLIIVPNDVLRKQYAEQYDNNKMVKIITYQIIKNKTAQNIVKKYGDIENIICDECHHLGDNKWRKQIERLNNIIKAKIVGLTATPLRGDSRNVVYDFFKDSP